MSTYKLHCFGQSGHSYKVALFLELSGLDWEPVYTDYFTGQTRTQSFRSTLNVQGECPVLEYGSKRLTQSGAILTSLAESTGHFSGKNEEERYEILRWLLFDNHKLSSNLGSYRYEHSIAPGSFMPDVKVFLKNRVDQALAILETHLQNTRYIASALYFSIADISMAGYLLYPEEEFGLDMKKEYPEIYRWLSTIRSLPRWKGPYELMPMQKSKMS